MAKQPMTDEELAAFEKKLGEAVSTMTGRIGDEPRYQITGEIIPPDQRDLDQKEE